MTEATTNVPAAVQALVVLRAVVAALGECAKPAWWRTQFLTDAGLRAVQRVFPRTGIAAAIKSTSGAARIEHDRLIGVGGRYHLFRLPTSLEQAIAHALSEAAVLPEIGHALQGGVDGLLARLESLASGKKLSLIEGPVSLGPANRLHQASAVADMAANYRCAFLASVRSYPYFDGPEGQR